MSPHVGFPRGHVLRKTTRAASPTTYAAGATSKKRTFKRDTMRLGAVLQRGVGLVERVPGAVALLHHPAQLRVAARDRLRIAADLVVEIREPQPKPLAREAKRIGGKRGSHAVTFAGAAVATSSR